MAVGPTAQRSSHHRGGILLISRSQFAIRPTIRNHHTIKRDDIIKRVADLVGKPHTVDLKHYDQLILVDVYRVSTISPWPRAAIYARGPRSEQDFLEYPGYQHRRE